MPTSSSLPNSQRAVRKAAILIASLDSASADVLLDKMDPEQARRVRDAVMDLHEVPTGEEEAVLFDFLRAGGRLPGTDVPGVELDDSLARKLVAGRPAINEMPAREQKSGSFKLLHEATPDSLARHLINEHPQTIAVVVAHLPAQQAAQLVKHFAPRLQASVLRRVAELDAADPAVLQTLEQQLETLLSDEIRASKNRRHGAAAVASILRAAGQDGDELLANLAEYDQTMVSLLPADRRESVPRRAAQPPHLVESSEPRSESPRGKAGRPVTQAHASLDRQPHSPSRRAVDGAADPSHATHHRDQTMTFDDLLALDDQQLACVLAGQPSDILLLALAGASEQLLGRLTGQLSSHDAGCLRQKIQAVLPVRLADIEHAQQQVAAAAARRADQGLLNRPERARRAAG